jgi:molecular chaperone HtpG
VSREILQQSAPLEKIKSNLVHKLLTSLDELKRKQYAKYVGFFKELGPIIKEGVHQDWTNRQQIAELLLFESTKTERGHYTTLSQYVDSMTVSQSEIYYLTGENREMLENSPYLESFKAGGQEILLLTDPIDEFVVSAMTEFKGKKLKAVDKGDLTTSQTDEAKKKEFQTLLECMKVKLPEIKDVRLSARLKESAVCLVADEGELGAHMERLMARWGREHEIPTSKKILEVNPDHRTIKALKAVFDKNAADERLEKYARVLYDQAVIAEGSKVKDPLAFAQRINDLLAGDAERG